MKTHTLIIASVGILAWQTACDGGKSTPRQPPPTGNENAVPPPPTDREGTRADVGEEPGDDSETVELADEPRIDLVSNRYRFHLYRDGLIVPFASPGFRKYTQEYRRPFESVVEVDGRPGRVLSRRVAELRVPWHSGEAATVRLWAHGLSSGQRVQLDVNGRRADVVAVPDEWSEVVLSVAADLLRPGENELRLHASKAGRAGKERSYGLYHAMEIVRGDVGEAGEWPTLVPDARVTSGAQSDGEVSGLGRVGRMVIYLEVPDSAWLRVRIGAREETAFRITVTPIDGDRHELLNTTAKGGWTEHSVSLAAHADELVALELESDGGAWGEPFIGLEAVPVAERPPPVENLILLVVDALRSDRLKLYGETRVETPNFTAAGANAAVYRYNQAASPSSPPSHGSIQTGMIPRVHGVAGDRSKLDPGTPMISTQLGAAGIATAYYGNNPFGMARLEEPGEWTAFHQPNKEGKGIDCTVLMREMLGFAKEQNAAGERFFISSLPYEPHTPYRYHEAISDRYHDGSWGPPVGKNVTGYLLNDLASGKVTLDDAQWSQLRALYDGEVTHMDECFGQLQEGLKAAGLAESTAIVLTSDHGEGMFEHGRMGHAFGHYAELADVPLVLYVPGLIEDGPKNIEVVTNHIDIAPTVLDLMGVAPSDRIQGESVLPLALRHGPWTPRVVSLEYGKSFALRSRRWKLIVDYAGRESLYDLRSDPTEQHDLAGERPAAMRYLRDLAGFFLEYRRDWRTSTWGTLNNHRDGLTAHVEARP